MRGKNTVIQYEEAAATSFSGGSERSCLAGLLQEYSLHVLGAVGDAPQGIVREVAPLLDEEVLQACQRGIGPDAREVDRAIPELGVVPTRLVHVLDMPHD